MSVVFMAAVFLPLVQGQAPPAGEVRRAIIQLKPPGDPIYVEEAPEAPRTYQRPKVDRFSRDGEGIALHGYDVVSYQEKRAEKGTAEWVAEYGGIRWRFASERHREEFQKHPESYLPEYGGFCAYSVGRGYPATADPRAFVVERGKLYLFFDRAVQAVWEQDRARLVDAADRNWPKLHREP